MCGRATLRIVLSTPCMMFASMIEIVIMPRFGTGANASPLTADAPRAASTAHPLAASYPSPNLTRGARGEGWGECLSGSAVTYPAPAALDQISFMAGWIWRIETIIEEDSAECAIKRGR